jgi:hypothetical protein
VFVFYLIFLGRDSQNFLSKIINIFVTSDLKILGFLILLVLFGDYIKIGKKDIYSKLIRNQFPMCNWFTNAHQSYENLTNFPLEVFCISILISIIVNSAHLHLSIVLYLSYTMSLCFTSEVVTNI